MDSNATPTMPALSAVSFSARNPRPPQEPGHAGGEDLPAGASLRPTRRPRRVLLLVLAVWALMPIAGPEAMGRGSCIGSDGQEYRYSIQNSQEILRYDTHYLFPAEVNAIVADSAAVWVRDTSYAAGGFIRVLHNAYCGVGTGCSDGTTPVDYDGFGYAAIYAARSSSASLESFSTEYPVSGGAIPGNRNVVRDANGTAMYGMTHPRLLGVSDAEWWLFHVSGGDIYAAKAGSATAGDFVDDTADCGASTGASCSPATFATPVLDNDQMATDTGKSSYGSSTNGLSSTVAFLQVKIGGAAYFRIFVSGTDGDFRNPLAIYTYLAPASDLRSWRFEGGPRVGDDSSSDPTQYALRPASKLIRRRGGCVTLFFQGWDATMYLPVIRYANSSDSGLSFGTPRTLTDSSGSELTSVSGAEFVRAKRQWFILYDKTPDADGDHTADGGAINMGELVFEN